MDYKTHPSFPVLAAVMGPELAEKAIREAEIAKTKANQAETVSSKEARQIIIPHSMNKLDAAKELKRQWDDEEQIINVSREFPNWHWSDVLVAAKRAAEEYFGWIRGKSKQSFFGTRRPQEIDIVVDIKNGQKLTETCFYGSITASIWEDATLEVGAGRVFAEVKKRYANEVREFFDLIQKTLDTRSIYRGKAITVTKDESPWGDVSLHFDIFEMKTSDKIVLNDDIESIVQNFIIDDLGQEGKRCYLFSGGYGNGKTETAMRVGKAGLDKQMAYFYCKDADVFHMLLKNAVNYQPCIVFLEDVDEIGSGTKRDADMNRILNTLDGVQTKGNDLTVIFTTNHENKINPALRRPGRIDLVINFDNPDKVSVAKIYEAYLKPHGGNHNYEKLAENTPEAPGAVVAEIAKRAVKLCKKRGKYTDDLVSAAINSMKHHLKLMSEPVEEEKNGSMTIQVSGAQMKIEKKSVSSN